MLRNSVIYKSVLSLTLILFSSSLYAQSPVTVFGPETFKASLKGENYNRNFTAQSNSDGVLTLLNGDGSDLSQQTCRGNVVQKLACGLKNLALALQVALTRAQVVEVTLNGQKVVTNGIYKSEKGQLQIAIKTKSGQPVNAVVNQLLVKIKGSPLAKITVSVKAQGSINNISPIAQFSFLPDGAIAPASVSFSAIASQDPDGSIVSYTWNFGDPASGVMNTAQGILAQHNYILPGIYQATLTVTDNQGATSTISRPITVNADTTAPMIAVNPNSGTLINNNLVAFSGSANELLSSVTAQSLTGSVSVLLNPDQLTFVGTFSVSQRGVQAFTIQATDRYGNVSSNQVSYNFNFNSAPLAVITADRTNGDAPLVVQFNGLNSSDPNGDSLSFSWNFGDGASASGSQVTHTFQNAGTYTTVLTVTDSLGLNSQAQLVITVNEGGAGEQDPRDVAPPLDDGNQDLFQEQIKFLYSGLNPIQKDVLAGSLMEPLVALVRGRVLDDTGTPLGGVKVNVPFFPQLGYSITRSNGEFDLVVNGGGPVNFRFEKDGYLFVDRNFRINTLETFTLPDVIMIQPDSRVTVISSNSPVAQTVESNIFSDEDGQRKASIVIPANTQAFIVRPDGVRVPAGSLSLRITEYTVGDNGPAKMPAPLPPSTSYTYAFDVSADQALAIGSKHIEFSQPVAYYVNNFLGFPNGSQVPYGIYDEVLAKWVAQPDGRVIRILSIQNGTASVSVNAQNTVASAQELLNLGINDQELVRLAQSYPAGSSLWRVRTQRFSPGDLNWIGTFIRQVLAQNPIKKFIEAFDNPRVQVCGSRIDMSTFGVREDIPLVGVPFGLHYHSRREGGFKLNRQIQIPVTSATPPASLESIEIDVHVAGQKLSKKVLPAPNLTESFDWDGLDIYGRPIATTTAQVRVNFNYNSTFLLPQLNVVASFGLPSLSLTTSNVPGRAPLSVGQAFSIRVEGAATQPVGRISIGGWSIDPVHFYDPINRVLHLGNGDQLTLRTVRSITNTIAGLQDSAGSTGDSNQAAVARLNSPSGLALGPDGSIYIADNGNLKLRKIDPSGIITTILGTGVSGDSGDGGPAILAQVRSLGRPVVARDGRLFVPDPLSHKVRMIDTNGIVSTFAGTGLQGFNGDGGLASQAQLRSPQAVALSMDQSLIIADSGNNRIRKVAGDGLISTIAGTGVASYSGDDGAALASTLNNPSDIAVDTADRIFVVDKGNQAVRVIALGQISKFTGRGTLFPNFNTIQAVPVDDLSFDVETIDINSQGQVFLGNVNYVLMVDQMGMVQPLSGFGVTSPFREANFLQDNVQASIAYYRRISGLLALNDGSVLVTDRDSQRVRRITEGLPSFNVNGYNIASQDSTEIYQFAKNGRHLRTLFARTGSVKWDFTYDSKGFLTELKDEAGLITRIVRNPVNNAPTRIEGPFGKVTQLTVDANNRVQTVTNPSGETYRMNYSALGLLESFEKPNGARNFFQYNSDGEVVTDTAPGGFVQSFSKQFTDGTFFDTETRFRTMAGGKSEKLAVTIYPNTPGFSGDYTQASGLVTTISQTDTTYFTTTVGEDIRVTSLPDPRLGSTSLRLSSGLTSLGGFIDQFSITNQITRRNPVNYFDYTQVETRSSLRSGGSAVIATTTYDGSNKTETTRSPVGRESQIVIDAQERPVSVQIGNLHPVSLEYDQQGRLLRTNQNGRISSISYGPDGLPSSITDSLGQVNQFNRDASSRVTRQTLPDNRDILFRYDSVSQVTGITPPGRLIHEFVFDLAGQLLSYIHPQVDGGSNQTLYRYSLDRDLVGVTRPDGTELQYTLNNNFLVSRISSPTGTLVFSYPRAGYEKDYQVESDSGRLTASVSRTGETLIQSTVFLSIGNFGAAAVGGVSYAYNSPGGPTTETYFATLNQALINTQVSKTYDSDDLLVSAGALSLSRDPVNGLINGTQLLNVSTSTSYSGFAEPIQNITRFNGSTLFSESFTRDNAGRITSKVVQTSAGIKTFGYSYDLSGRLSQVTENGVQVASYNYDQNSNRISGNVRGTSVSGSYDAQDRMTRYNGFDYTHNLNGELIQKRDLNNNVTNYNWNSFGHLTGVTTGSLTINYKVDGIGRRVNKSIGSQSVRTWFYRNEIQIASELDENNNARAYFVYGSLPHVPDFMVMVGSNETYRFIHDQLGSIRMVVNASTGQIAQEIEYDEFGVVLRDTNPGFQPFGFAGGHYDHDTGLVHFGARSYDPGVGRWVSKDPIGFAGGDTNLYSYVGQNPLNFVDPSGLSSRDVAQFEKAFNQLVKSMNDNGLRRPGSGDINGYLNNGAITLSVLGVSTTGDGYQGCIGQAELAQKNLGNIGKTDDQWKFSIEPNPFGTHFFLEARSSNPSDPLLIIDPWKNSFLKQDR